MRPAKERWRATLLAAILGLTAPPGLSLETPSFTVDPLRGRAEVSTVITLRGGAFEPGARVSLLGGGPFLKGSYILPEGARDVEVQGDRACVAYYSHASKLGGIQILDVSDPGEPVRIGGFATGDSGVAVRSREGLAYVAFLNPYTFLGGLHIVDVTRPEEPLRLGTFYTFLDPRAIVVDGAHAYVADGAGGLRIVDVSDPSSPGEAAAYDSPGTASDVAIAAGHAFLADGEGGLRIVDVRVPTAPVEAGAYAAPGAAILSVAVALPYAYATDATRGLLVLDVSDSGNPSLVGEIPLADEAAGLAVAGNLAYVAAGTSGLQIVDLSDPRRPEVIGGRGLDGNAGYFFDVVVRGGEAVVADLLNGVQVIDVTFPAAPALAGGLDLPGNAAAIAAEGTTGLVAAGEGGLAVLDFDPDGGPRLRARIDTPASALGVAAAGSHAILAAGAAGLLVADLSDPLAVVITAVRDTPGEALGVAYAGGRAYVADGSRGLAVFDLADPAAPLLIGTLDTAGTSRGVAVAGRLAYVADDFRGLLIFDVAEPGSPALVGRFDTPGRAVGVAVSGRHAYVADLNRGVQIVDVSRPEAPALVASVGTRGAAAGVALLGSRLLVADGFSGLLEYDVSDPSSPVLAGLYDTPGVAGAVAVLEGTAGSAASAPGSSMALVADGMRGVRVARLNPPLSPPVATTDAGLSQEVPAGFTPGPYDVLVTGPGAAVDPPLRDGFIVCAARPLSARLEPSRVPASAVGPTAAPWRLVVEGDAAFFRPEPRHVARLLLPALPGAPEIGHASGRSAIEVRQAKHGGPFSILLSGPDREAMAAFWETIAVQGGIDLPRIDAHNYGDLRLALQPGNGAGAPQRYRYEFVDGRLVAARAWGSGADLRFTVTAADALGCESEATTAFAATPRFGASAVLRPPTRLTAPPAPGTTGR